MRKQPLFDKPDVIAWRIKGDGAKMLGFATDRDVHIRRLREKEAKTSAGHPLSRGRSKPGLKGMSSSSALRRLISARIFL